ncbi:PAS domain-containing sensor histidine kinase [Pelotomaculum propionicicum]|uniref:PAS domain-containing sensor histidine kinase n=1 Tax=Pelotomaculum propionicicum TaxID=258475 RepID=UPI003B76235B
MKDEEKSKEQLINELKELRHRNFRLLEESRGREKHYLSIAQAARNAIISVDCRGNITFFNYAAETMFGYSSRLVLGKPVTIIMPERFHEVCQKGLERFIRTGESDFIGKTIEISGLKKDGGEFPVEMYISSWKAGSETYFTSNIRDITERKQAEDELKSAKEQLESFINNSADAIAIWDREGTILQINKAFEDTFGWAVSELDGMKLQMVPEHLLEEARGYIQKVTMQGKAVAYEAVRRRKDGSLLEVAITLTPIRDTARNIVAVASTWRDITEQVNMNREKQRLMEQTARAQRLASLSTISAGIAHEINQPLNTMKVIVDGMLYWHKRGRTLEQERVLKNLQKISAQVGRVDEIIKHMRSLVGSGSATEMELCNLNNAVSGALGVLGRQLTSHKINVVKKLAKDLPGVYGNKNRLEEVAINLLVNAMQALDKAAVEDKEITCSTNAAGEKVIMEISDNATGISDDIKDGIFDPFFTTKETGEGMGLGLSIVQTVLSGFSGQIEAFNNEKGGATFRVELPVKN